MSGAERAAMAGPGAVEAPEAGWPVRLPVVSEGPWRLEYPFRSRYLALGGGRALHYVDEGRGRPVVMVHGNPAWSFMWRPLITGLTGYRRLAPDQLGLGLSSRPSGRLRLADRINHLGLWLDSLKLDSPVHLIVHDWGGPVGLGWAVANPARIASLTIMNTGLARPAGWRTPAKLGLFALGPAFSRLLAVELNLFVGGLIRHGTVRPLTKAAESGFRAPLRLAAHRRAVGGFIRDIPMGPGHPSAPLLASIDRGFERLSDKPVLLAWGLRDFVFGPAFLDSFRARLPRARVLALESAGHWLLEDEPGLILEAVKAHLGQADGPGPGGADEAPEGRDSP